VVKERFSLGMIPPLSGHFTNANENSAFELKGANDNSELLAAVAV
jgi:hypothetical protein